METNQYCSELIQNLESELNEALNELTRIDDQGRTNYSLQNKINNLRSSLDAAKRLFTKTKSSE